MVDYKSIVFWNLLRVGIPLNEHVVRGKITVPSKFRLL